MAVVAVIVVVVVVAAEAVAVAAAALVVLVVVVVVVVVAGIACWLERRTRDPKVSRSNPGKSGWRIFFCRVNFVC